MRWFRVAAEAGYAKAQRNLAFRYARGEGIAADNVSALVWSSLATEAGLIEAARLRESLLERMPASEIALAKHKIEMERARIAAAQK